MFEYVVYIFIGESTFLFENTFKEKPLTTSFMGETWKLLNFNIFIDTWNIVNINCYTIDFFLSLKSYKLIWDTSLQIVAKFML